jgi:arylsulfate sulfotransferase
MKRCLLITVGAVFMVFSQVADASQADDTTITITGQAEGATPFISRLSLTVSNTAVLKSIQFTIATKPGSYTRPLSATYANYYLVDRGYENPQTGQILLPVYGLYDGYANTVTLTYRFMDGSSRQASTTIATGTFNDPCGYKNPTFLQHRSNAALSYDYILLSGRCNSYSPAIIDTDGALRWVSTTATNYLSFSANFFDNAVYWAYGHDLYRIDLDGTFTLVGDYSNLGINDFHHNIDRGKFGVILEADTLSQVESVIIEVSPVGAVLHRWDMANIITQAMIAGGDDPNQFVYHSPTDWFHNNGVAYNRADNSLIVSSRENFLICIDYDTGAIKWILGDTTKRWYEFPSLRRFALTLAPGSLPPIGQHAPSITYDQDILMLDNGFFSSFQQPPGVNRNYASPRKYQVNLGTRMATEVWNHEMGRTILSPICGSTYEDAPQNYLVDYAVVGGLQAQQQYAELLGLNAAGETVFYFQYPTNFCDEIYNARPIHLENAQFATVGPQLLNLSTRGTVMGGDNVLISGFIVSGTDPKTVVIRALGPSLAGLGLSGVLSDPVLSLYDSTGTLIATNDNWETDIGAQLMAQNGLAPSNPYESATLQTLMPGAYTAVVRGNNGAQGISLTEVYDLFTAGYNSKLANISCRGFVGTNDNVLISGFIIGDVASSTVIVRALGPSLASSGVSQPLSDPTLTIYDSNGSVIASNDNWQQDANAIDIQRNGLAPPNPYESATVLHLPAGAYTAIVRGNGGGTGVTLTEVYSLD